MKYCYILTDYPWWRGDFYGLNVDNGKRPCQFLPETCHGTAVFDHSAGDFCSFVTQGQVFVSRKSNEEIFLAVFKPRQPDHTKLVNTKPVISHNCLFIPQSLQFISKTFQSYCQLIEKQYLRARLLVLVLLIMWSVWDVPAWAAKSHFFFRRQHGNFYST